MKFSDFTDDVTMHGIKYVFTNNTSKIKRFIWLFLVLAAIAYFGWMMSNFIIKLAGNPISTTLRYESRKQLESPAITICNRNVIKRSALYKYLATSGNMKMYDLILSLWNDQHRKEWPIDWADPEWEKVANITGEETFELLRQFSHQMRYGGFLYGSMWESCNYGVATGSATNASRHRCFQMMTPVVTDAGFCWTYNETYVINKASAEGGLQFALSVEVDDYFIGPRSYSEGISVLAHDRREVPLMNEMAVGIAPGTESYVQLSKSVVNRVPPPADYDRATCFDAETLPNPLKHFDVYSYSACVRECKTNYTVERCGCREAFQADFADVPICSFFDMMTCSVDANEYFYEDDDAGFKLCECPEPCKETSYGVQISNYRFPSTGYFAAYGLTANSETVQFMSRNFIVMHLYYGKLGYQSMTEEKLYTAGDFFADFGGTLGLCIGASLLTICEFCQYFVLMLANLFDTINKKEDGNLVKVMPAPTANIQPMAIPDVENKQKY